MPTQAQAPNNEINAVQDILTNFDKIMYDKCAKSTWRETSFLLIHAFVFESNGGMR